MRKPFEMTKKQKRSKKIISKLYDDMSKHYISIRMQRKDNKKPSLETYKEDRTKSNTPFGLQLNVSTYINITTIGAKRMWED